MTTRRANPLHRADERRIHLGVWSASAIGREASGRTDNVTGSGIWNRSRGRRTGPLSMAASWDWPGGHPSWDLRVLTSIEVSATAAAARSPDVVAHALWACLDTPKVIDRAPSNFHHRPARARLRAAPGTAAGGPTAGCRPSGGGTRRRRRRVPRFARTPRRLHRIPKLGEFVPTVDQPTVEVERRGRHGSGAVRPAARQGDRGSKRMGMARSPPREMSTHRDGSPRCGQCRSVGR